MIAPPALSGLNVSYALEGIKENSGPDIKYVRTGALIVGYFSDLVYSSFRLL